MDSLVAIGSSLPPVQARSIAGREAASAQSAPWFSPVDPNPTAALDSLKGKDPATDQQLMLHFISHINAECFISLLQILDPKPDDDRARTEYRRHYQQLRESLEVPLPLRDPAPVGVPRDPLW